MEIAWFMHVDVRNGLVCVRNEPLCVYKIRIDACIVWLSGNNLELYCFIRYFIVGISSTYKLLAAWDFNNHTKSYTENEARKRRKNNTNCILNIILDKQITFFPHSAIGFGRSARREIGTIYQHHAYDSFFVCVLFRSFKIKKCLNCMFDVFLSRQKIEIYHAWTLLLRSFYFISFGFFFHYSFAHFFYIWVFFSFGECVQLMICANSILSKNKQTNVCTKWYGHWVDIANCGWQQFMYRFDIRSWDWMAAHLIIALPVECVFGTKHLKISLLAWAKRLGYQNLSSNSFGFSPILLIASRLEIIKCK